MPPKIYTVDRSPPCRAVYLTARALGISLELQQMDVPGGEHLQPNFLKTTEKENVEIDISSPATSCWIKQKFRELFGDDSDTESLAEDPPCRPKTPDMQFGVVKHLAEAGTSLGGWVWFPGLPKEKGGHDEYLLNLNPQHTVPTMDDDGFILWDSHAINAYLVDKYGKDDSLYPKDRKRRAVVDQRLHFDSAIVFGALVKMAKPIRLGLTKTIPDEKLEHALESYDFLEAFLEGNDWVVPGEDVTIADFNLLTTVTSLDFLVPIDFEKYPNIKGWIERAKTLPYYDANQKGLDDFNTLFKKCLAAE